MVRLEPCSLQRAYKEARGLVSDGGKVAHPRRIGWVISMDDWAQIRILRKDGMPIGKIAATVGCAKKTVERALASNTPASCSKRAPKKTAFD